MKNYDAKEGAGSEVNRLFIKFIITVVILVLLTYVTVCHALGAPLPFFFDPENNRAGWLCLFQLILSLVLLAVNFPCFKRGLLAAVRRAPDSDTLVTMCVAVGWVYSVAAAVLVFIGADNGNGEWYGLYSTLQIENIALLFTFYDLVSWLEQRHYLKINEKVGQKNDIVKPCARGLADKTAGAFVPLAALITLLTFFVWLLIDGFSVSRCVIYAVNVMFCFCPCALALSTIVPFIFSLVRGGESGVTFRNFENMQTIGEVNCVLINKNFFESENGKPREEAVQVVSWLKSRGSRVAMLADDGYADAKFIAKRVGIDDFVADASPDDKLKAVTNIQQVGGRVAYVGCDDTDLPALNQADIAICSGGTETAAASADVVLNGGAGALKSAFCMAKAAVGTVKSNLFIAFLINLAAIPLAAGVFKSFSVNYMPLVFFVCALIGSVLIILNSLRLKLKNKKGE